MAVTEGVGHSRVLNRRRWEDYRSLKQYHQNSRIDEVIIEGSTTTAGGATEISFVTGDIMIYIGAAAQAYIRCEADDGNQDDKYVYLQYQTTTGAVQDWVTADIDSSVDSTTEVAIGSTDFWRCRQMYSEVESKSAGGAMIFLTDADSGGGDEWAFISDGQSQFALQRFFTQPSATCASYLGRVKVSTSYVQEGDTVVSGYLLDVTYTPKVLNAAEAQPATDITQSFQWTDELIWEPCIELAPATEVIFKVGDIGAAGIVHIEAIMLEVYA